MGGKGEPHLEGSSSKLAGDTSSDGVGKNQGSVAQMSLALSASSGTSN